MPRKRKKGKGEVNDYRYDEARRKNNPPAGIAPTYEKHKREKQTYSYDPHLDPQLQWSGKAEHTAFEVDVLPLHIHERISTRAILEAVRKPEPQLSLFGETELPADQQIEFYQHDVNWANRLVLGDSLLVMNSLLVKEGMAGKVQMIYVDPPYGIKYASNFQPRIDKRDVKDKDEDLTHEPEQIKAYRDTWQLGIHSYLTYLRDRLLLSKELLADTGSIFVQINDENVHLVRGLLDEVFGSENFMSVISFIKRSPQPDIALPGVTDYLLWYAKERSYVKYRQLYLTKIAGGTGATGYDNIIFPDGTYRKATQEEINNFSLLPEGTRLFTRGDLTSSHYYESPGFKFQGQVYTSGKRYWSTSIESLRRLAEASRIIPSGNSISYVRCFDDFRVMLLSNVWNDTNTGFMGDKVYAVQTLTKVIERCMLMTTDPGDLVFDPTCGSGTAAYCAERWGRRWITCDTSRVALALARERIMTAKFDYYELADPERGPQGGFNYETVPHITLKSIAHNTEIDEIAAKYQPKIDDALAELNKALKKKWKEWEVPHDVDKDWAKETKAAHKRFWNARRKKRQEIDESINRYAPQETLYDRPQTKSGVVRVSGPFTVEGIPAPTIQDPSEAPIPQFEVEEAQARISDKAGDYLSSMINLLKQQGGVIFPGGKKMNFTNLRAATTPGFIHAEAETEQNGSTLKVALSFGPKHGPLTAYQVQEATRSAYMKAYNVLIFAGFSYDPEAQALIEETEVKELEVHFANIAPDVLVGDLLKTTRASQIFTVFGQPDVAVTPQKDDTYVVELRGVDIYDPIKGEVKSTSGENVAAWFLDSDYDGVTFHISQAFFPGDPKAWSKLQRALKAQIDEETFHKMRGTKSFPFQSGEHKRVAAKVIDFRGNEVMRIEKL